MAVAHDAVTESAIFTTLSPHTFTHTPSGTPRGVLVAIGQLGSTNPNAMITDVTYGGVPLRRVGYEADLSGEPGAVFLYFLGKNIPTGLQTVSITHTGVFNEKWAAVATVTASSHTHVGSAASSTETFTGSTFSPILFKGENTGLAYFVGYNGAILTNRTLVGGMSSLSLEHDWPSASVAFARETSTSSGPVTIGWTQSAADDHAILGVNIYETVPNPHVQGAKPTLNTGGTTSVVVQMQGDLEGKDLFMFVISRDSTSGSSNVACSGGTGSWTAVTSDADKKIWVFWKRGVTADIGAQISVTSAVGSATGGLLWTTDTGDGTNPVTDLTIETNAAADETHASITPTDSASVVMFAVGDYGNDTNAVTSIAGATMGSMEPDWFERLSTGGNDSRITVTGRYLASGATGSVTWTQTDSTTKSVLFAVSPMPLPTTSAATLEVRTPRVDLVQGIPPPAPIVVGTGEIISLGQPTSASPASTGAANSNIGHKTVVHRKPERLTRSVAVGGFGIPQLFNPCFHAQTFTDEGIAPGPSTHRYIHGPNIPVLSGDGPPILNGQPYEEQWMFVQIGNHDGEWVAEYDPDWPTFGSEYLFGIYRWQAVGGGAPSSSSKLMLLITDELCDPPAGVNWIRRHYSAADDVEAVWSHDGAGRTYPMYHDFQQMIFNIRVSDLGCAPELVIFADAYSREGVLLEHREYNEAITSTDWDSYGIHSGNDPTFIFFPATAYYYHVGWQIVRTQAGPASYFYLREPWMDWTIYSSENS